MASSERKPLTRTQPLVCAPAAEAGACLACAGWFEAGDPVAKIGMGPGSDPEQRFRARRGWAYDGPAVVIHWACATGFEGDGPNPELAPLPEDLFPCRDPTKSG